jgi:ring-1,2-phenylacetyl-CoA epoxidase subunit PaaE
MLFNLFKSKEEKNKRTQYLSLKVREVVKETADTVTIFFEQPEPFLDYKPGQFLTVLLDINGQKARRSYSLCTSPYVDPYPGITVKRIRDGVVSNYLNDKIRPGKTMEIMKPMGHFTMDFHSQNKRHFVMVTGGSGITPIMGLTKSILINEPHSEVTLLYCSRSEEQIIFKDQLAILQDKYPGKLRVIHNLTQPGENWTGLKGRIDAERIKEVMVKNVYPEAEKIQYLTCGPEGLMEVTLATLQNLGVGKENILKESFFTAKSEKTAVSGSEMEEAPPLTREVKIVLEGEDYEFEVLPDKTILEAGLEENIDMPYSCQSGLCTACRGKLISGEVKMEEDAGLSESEIKDGYILCCVSHPMSGDVKINIE